MKKALYVATVDIHIKSFHLPYLKLLHDKGYEVHVATNGDEIFPFCDVKHQICIERSPFKLSNLKAISNLLHIILRIWEVFNMYSCLHQYSNINSMKKKEGTILASYHSFKFLVNLPLWSASLFRI